MSDKFHPLTPEEKECFIKAFKGSLPADFGDLSQTNILQREYDFYPEWLYIQIERKGSIRPRSLLYKEEDICILNWQVKDLIDFNLNAPLILSINNVLEYVSFFFAHVKGPGGVMRLISHYDDLRWREEPSPQERRALNSFLRAPHLLTWDDHNKTYEVGVFFLFQQNLFQARIFVRVDGSVEIKDRTVQVEEMPVLDEMSE